MRKWGRDKNVSGAFISDEGLSVGMFLDGSIELVGGAAFLADTRTLVVGDIHLGEEEALARAGMLVPKQAFGDLQARLAGLVEATRPSLLVFDGDLIHEFGRIPDEEWRHLRRLLGELRLRCTVAAIKGNHDVMLPAMAGPLELSLHDWMVCGTTLLIHGDRVPPRPALSGVRRIVIGHEHPAVRLSDGVRTETYQCYLWGRWKGKQVLVLPAMSALHEGGDVLTRPPLGPLLGRIKKFEVIAMEGRSLVKLGRAGLLEAYSISPSPSPADPVHRRVS